MNRIFYDVQVTQRAGGNGENWKPICSKTHQACPQLCGATGFCQNKQEEKSTKTQTHSGWDWFCPPHFPEEPGAYICVVAKSGEYPILALNLKLKYLEYAQGEDNFRGLEEGEYVPRWLGKIYAPSSGRHLSPSPGLRWVRASERLPEKCNDVIIRVIGKPVEVAVGCVADSEEEWAVDGCSWFYYDTEWLDESPSLPGEQDPAPKLADTIKWMSEGARRNLKSCETNLLEAHYEGYLEALEELSKEMELTPSAEKGEQVEGMAFENISRIIHPAIESTDRTLPFAPPSVEADRQDTRKRGLKAFDDSMKNTLGELIEPEENPFAEAEADQQVPEEIMQWVNTKADDLAEDFKTWQGIKEGDTDPYAYRYGAKAGAIAMYRKMAGEILKANTRYSDTILDLRKAEKEIAVLKESFKSSIYQHDQDMEIVKGEREELKMWQAVAKTSISRLETEIEALAAERTAYRDLLEDLDEAKTNQAVEKCIDKIAPLIKQFTNKNKDNG